MADVTTNTPAVSNGTDGARKWLIAASRRSDLAMAMGVVTILVVLILPLPDWLLDIGLAFSITFSVLILMTALFIEKPLEFSTFPTVLLLATMMRLSLNLAPRLILSTVTSGRTPRQGDRSFGGFVMGAICHRHHVFSIC